MKFIRQILFFLFVPLATQGQTIHIDEGRIAYKGTVDVVNASREELYERAKEAMHNVKWEKKNIVVENKKFGMITARGTLRLITPYHLVRTVEYLAELTVDDGKYKYRIDSVYFKQVERGGKTIVMPSPKLLKAVEETGKVAVDTEKILNELDMNLQKLIVLINNDMRKTTVADNDATRNN